MTLRSRMLGTTVAGLAATSLVAAAAAGAAPTANDKNRPDQANSAEASKASPGRNGFDKGKGNKGTLEVQLLSFNDFHGHLEPDSDGNGGAAAMAGVVQQLRAQQGDKTSITVAAGDLIGASQFASAVFHDEPTSELLEALGLDASAVGNHEFDEGVDELLRIQNGGCHPVDGCYDAAEPYDGADFPYLAANVVWKDSGEPILPPYYVEKVKGVNIGFIGVVTSDLPILVSPSGIADVNVLDEAETINRYAAELQSQGVEVIVALMHEGGRQDTEDADSNGCENLVGPLADINAAVDPSVDVLITGHSHSGYVCELTDPAGNIRLATQANDYGDLVTETTLVIDRRTKDVIRERSTAYNHVVNADSPVDPTVAAIVQQWLDLAEPIAARVVGTVAEDITGDSGGNRGIETPMADLIADAILWGTDGADEGGAQIAFMNVGGVRDSFVYNEITNGERPGEITYAEAADVAPFGNLLVTMDLTGAQIEAVLEQQWNPTRSRSMLALGVSEGFTYTWDPVTHTVVEGSMRLNGQPIQADQVYRVATLNFLAEGGDGFTAFTQGTNLTGGPEDLANLIAFLAAHPALTAPEDRVTGL